MRYLANLRKFRRYLQGRGVDIRETIVNQVYAAPGERVVVPGMYDDDVVISALDLDGFVDVTADLRDGPAAAALVLFNGVSGKQTSVTSRAAGSGGNLIKVLARANVKGASQPLEVSVVNNSDGTVTIVVDLATDGAGAALATSVNGSNAVAATINQHQVAGKMVRAVGTGSTAWTAFAATALTGGDDFNKGGVRAYVDTDVLYGVDADLRFTARLRLPDTDPTRFTSGNAITVEYDEATPVGAVDVTGNAIVVNIGAGTTARDVKHFLEASPAAMDLIEVSFVKGMAGTGIVGEGTWQLAGGEEPGVRFLIFDASGKPVKLLWLTKDAV